MKTRIIAAAVLVPVLLLVVLAAPKPLAAVIFGLMLAIGVYELLFRTGLVKHPRLVVYSCVMAFATSMWSCFGAVHAVAVLGILAFFMVLFAETMADHVRVRFDMVAMCLLAGLVIPYLLTALIRILTMKIGRYVIMVPFVVAFMSDAGAYFVGLRFGKHKLAPKVSPKKTREGAVGGLVGGMVGMIIFRIVFFLVTEVQLNIGWCVLLGLVGAAMGQLGDLSFSAIKREYGIKDYGRLLPGHGGVLDRFDSVIFAAPIVWLIISSVTMY